MVWAIKWPHSSMKKNYPPNEAKVIDTVADCIDVDEAPRLMFLVESPAKLYGF